MTSHRNGRTASDLLKGSTGEMDIIDSVLAPMFTIAALAGVGLGAFEMYGHQASGVFYSMGGTDFTFAFTVGVVALAIAALSNSPDTHQWSQWNWGIAATGVVSFVALEFMPDVQNAVVGDDTLGLAVFIAQAASFYALAYL
jgi:hypothetical protein